MNKCLHERRCILPQQQTCVILGMVILSGYLQISLGPCLFAPRPWLILRRSRLEDGPAIVNIQSPLKVGCTRNRLIAGPDRASLSPHSLSPAITDSDRIHRERTILQMDNERKEGSEGRQYPSFALFGGWRIARPRDKSICRMVSGGFAQLFPKRWVVILSILRCLITTRHMLVSVFSKHNINTAFWLLRL